MASITPNSAGSMIYEPCSACYLGTKPTSNTFLDYLKNTNKDYYHLIQIAKMTAFYNTPLIPYTLFVAPTIPNISNITPDFARKLLLKSTIRGVITVNMLAPGLMLYSINNIDKLQVTVFDDLDGCSASCTRLRRNDQTAVVQKCTINNFYSNDCTPGVVECNLYPSTTSLSAFGAQRSAKTVQIDNRTLTHGDILVEKGAVHILDSPLWPV